MTLAELTLDQTIWAGATNALFTAVFVSVGAGLVVLWFQNRAENSRRTAQHDQEDKLQRRLLEHQTRAALRKNYARLLDVQRRSREISLQLAKAGGASADVTLEQAATQTHAEFIVEYHRLNLDVTEEMWREARALRHILDDMLESGRLGDAKACAGLAELARNARQNLERTFRERLGYKPLQERHPVGNYDKTSK